MIDPVLDAVDALWRVGKYVLLALLTVAMCVLNYYATCNWVE